MKRPTSVSVVFPAYNEEPNLGRVVGEAWAFLAEAVEDYRIIIVDDGSRDGTGALAARFAAADPAHLIVVSHDGNRGYGAAVRSGVDAALATGTDWVFLTDSDGQFDIRELALLLAVAGERGVEVVTGCRVRRADSATRRFNAYLWNSACRLLLGLRVHDVDCAFKLIDRRMLASLRLDGEAAVVSPELLAKAQRAGSRIAEVPVHHYPRQAGEQSGANPRVIARSLVGLLRLRLQLARQPHPQRLLAPR